MSTHTTTRSEDGTCQVPSNIRHHIMDFLSSTLTPDLLQSYENKLDVLSRSSYHIELIRQDLPQTGETYIPNSILLNMIDLFRIQRMKKLGNSQVKVILALLEELYGELRRGRDKLEAFLDGKGPVDVTLDEAAVQEHVLNLVQMASDFKAVTFPSRLHLKHQLISNPKCSNVQLELALNFKMPVVFNKTLTRAYADSVVLHWHVEGRPQHEPNEQFEIGYKPLQQKNEEEETQATVTTIATYCLKIMHLTPNRCYEFSVKRVESDDLVCALWKESIILRTKSKSLL